MGKFDGSGVWVQHAAWEMECGNGYKGSHPIKFSNGSIKVGDAYIQGIGWVRCKQCGVGAADGGPNYGAGPLPTEWEDDTAAFGVPTPNYVGWICPACGWKAVGFNKYGPDYLMSGILPLLCGKMCNSGETYKGLTKLVWQGAPPSAQLKSITLPITLLSFGYKFGSPELTETVNGIIPPWVIVDVRKTVRNPWGVPSLKSKNGLTKEVQEFVGRCGGTKKIIARMLSAAKNSKPAFAIGCTGGKHRSVAIVELAATALRGSGYVVDVVHRDMEKKGSYLKADAAAELED